VNHGHTAAVLHGMKVASIQLDFLWVVHCNHVSIWHRYGDKAPQK